MPLSEYLLGVAHLGAVLLAVIAGAVWVTRRSAGLAGPTRWLAVAVVATAALLAVHVIPAVLTVLSPGAVLVGAGAWCLVAWLLRGPAPVPASSPPSRPPALSGAVAAGAVLVFAAGVLGVLSLEVTLAFTGLDMVNFHLPGIARWLQSGSIWQVNQFGYDTAHGNYPHNGDFVLLATMLPWDSDFLVRLAMLPFAVLTVLAVLCAGRELGAPATTSLLAGLTVVSLPIVVEGLAEEGLPDPVLYFTFAAGVAFLLRHHRTGARGELVLAGVALGIAFGTKWYGVSAVAIVVAVWAAARLLALRRMRLVATQVAGLGALVLAGGGIWLVRNWVESANPFFPVKLELAGATIFDAPYDRVRAEAGWTIAGHIGDGAVWRDHLLPIYREFLGLPVAALAVLALVALVAALRSGDRRVATVLAGAALLGVMYIVLPYTAQGTEDFPAFAGFNTRYLLPALLVAAPAVAWLAARFPRARVPIEALLALAVVDGLLQRVDVPVARSLAIAAVLVLAAAAGVAAWRRRDRIARPAVRVAAGAAAVCALIAVVAVGHRVQREFLEQRYAGVDPTFDFVQREARSGARIALAGSWSRGIGAPLPMFGPRLGNEVAYLGRWPEEMLKRHTEERAFVSAFATGGFDLLIIGRGTLAAPGEPPAQDVTEERWARRAGFVEVARSDTYTLFLPPPGDAPS
jgi:hypothetical protein